MTSANASARRLLEAAGAEPLELALWERLVARDPREPWRSAIAAACLGRRRLGHTAMDLALPLDLGSGTPVAWPKAARDALKRLPIAQQIHHPSTDALHLTGGGPVVRLPDGRAALWGDFESECVVSEALAKRLLHRPPLPPADALRAGFAAFFSDAADPAGERQALAALCALGSRLMAVTGGPGTGKTTTVVRLLALWLMVRPTLRIALCAPTGKAAARLSESVARQRESLPMEPTLRRRIPAEVQTLHRLLGRMPGRLELRHDRSRLLPYDLVVVDEVSMVDQGLAAALIEALPEDAHLLLVGDPEQLDPVSPGRLFGDLVAALPAEVPTSIAELFAELANAKAPLPAVDGPRAGAMVPLLRAHRFREGGPIGKIARAIRERDPGLVQAAFDGGTQAEWTRGAPDRSELLARWIEARRAVAGARTPSRALEAAAKFQVLTATRVGPLGASALQAFAEAELQREHGWPRGALRLILRNDRMSGLSNGDLGVVWSEEGPPSVWFSSPIGPPRAFGASELPEHESGAALTVHKSQGSEFEEVWVILPEDPGEAPARALLYTAVTRARQKVRLFATEAVLEATLRQDAVRETGLRLALESMF